MRGISSFLGTEKEMYKGADTDNYKQERAKETWRSREDDRDSWRSCLSRVEEGIPSDRLSILY